MAGLILKDFLNLKHYSKMFLFFLAFFTIGSYAMDMQNYFTSMTVFLFIMLPITSFAYDQQAKWELFAVAMPVTRNEIVLGKYVLAGILIVLGSAFSILLAIVIQLLKGRAVDVPEMLTSTGTTAVLGAIFISIMIPLIYRYGVEKTRMLLLIVAGVPVLLVILLSEMGGGVPEMAEIQAWLFLSPVAAAAALAASYLISCKIFQRTDL